VHIKLRPAAIEKQLADLAVVRFIQAITQCSAENHRAQSINGARRLAKFSLTFDYVACAHSFEKYEIGAENG